MRKTEKIKPCLKFDFNNNNDTKSQFSYIKTSNNIKLNKDFSIYQKNDPVFITSKGLINNKTKELSN